MSKRLRISALCGAILYGVLAVASLLPAAMSVMMFDSPRSMESTLTWALFFGVAAIPFVLAISAVVLVIAFFRHAWKAAIVGLSMPVVLLVYDSIVVGLLEKLCGSNFSCP